MLATPELNRANVGPALGDGSGAVATLRLASGAGIVGAVSAADRMDSGFWPLSPELTFLNHGSYGAVPRPVLERQAELRARMERDPVRFFKVDLERLTDEVRVSLARYLNCRANDLAPMPNATVALCTVLANAARDLKLGPGDEVLVTDHEYMSVVNELERVCRATGAKVVKAKIPFPIEDPAEVTEAVLSAVTPRTKLAFVAHITSATSLIFPITAIVRGLMSRGVEVCVDGAHTPGQVQIDIDSLAPTYYVGSCHKWLSCPKGTGFLWVRADKQGPSAGNPFGFRPLSLSSRGHKVRPDRSLYLRDFDYVGTDDYTGMLSVPAAIECLGSLLPGGWAELYRRNHELALEGRRIVLEALGDGAAAPETMIGSMATILLPEPAEEMLSRTTEYDDPLQDALLSRHRVVAPVWRLASDNRRVLRISAQRYNTPEHYRILAKALVEELHREQPRRRLG